jgi:hypothetical protein
MISLVTKLKSLNRRDTLKQLLERKDSNYDGLKKNYTQLIINRQHCSQKKKNGQHIFIVL